MQHIVREVLKIFFNLEREKASWLDECLFIFVENLLSLFHWHFLVKFFCVG